MSHSEIVLSWDDFKLSDLSSLSSSVFNVAHKGYVFPAKLSLKEKSDKLFIMLHGRVQRPATPLPVFSRSNWGKILNGHILAICDPTLYLDEKIKIGWYIGNKKSHVLNGLVEIAEVVREKVGVESHKRVFYGSSGGGFASLIAASKVENGRAIAINCQTRITNYHSEPVELIGKIFDESSSPLKSEMEFPERWNAVEHYSNINSKLPRILYIQNTVDRFHYANHYLPFASVVGLSENSGINDSGSAMSIIYSHPSGHSSEPPEVVKQINAFGLDFLCTEDTQWDLIGKFREDLKIVPLPAMVVTAYFVERGVEVGCLLNSASGLSKDVRYAFYLLKNGQRVQIQKYSTNPEACFKLEIDKESRYDVIAFARDREGQKIFSRVSVKLPKMEMD